MLRNIFLLLLIFSCTLSAAQHNSSWKSAKQQKTYTLNCFWFDTKPFIYSTEDDEIAGVEHALMEQFKTFVETVYEVELELNWIRCQSFKQVYDTIKVVDGWNNLGVSALSITPERKQEIKYTPSYMPDISVIVSDYKLPIAYNENEFDSIFNNRTAITVRQTTFEQHLTSLKMERDLNFEIEYIPSISNLISKVARTENSFGYIDLPTYLTALQDTINVKRQYLFSFKNQGIGFIMPKESDWNEPFEDFFRQPNFPIINNTIIANYFGPDVPFLINNIASGAEISSKDEVLLLTKEKEIQAQELINSALKIQRENLLNTVFFLGIVILLLVAAFTYRQYRSKLKANLQLNEQKAETEAKNNKLVSLNDEKNNLIHILAHDLRAPINSISGLTELLKMKASDEQSKEVVEKIQNATERINSMIKKILDVESIESDKSNLNLEVVDLKEIASQVVDEFNENAQKKQITLKTKFKKSKKYTICGDKVYLFQVFENLVSNALKFSEPKTSVTVKLKRKGNKIRATVRDQGPGINVDDRKKLFNKFQKLSAKPTQGEQSTGLGLSIVKKYVDLMDGTIRVKSKVGQGTDFIIEFDFVT